jgi:hypothetical protein
MMDLGLSGSTLVSQLVEYTVALHLSDGFFIRIESPFTLDLPDRSISLSPEDSSAESFAPLRDLVGRVVTESTVDDAGALTVAFEGDARLLVEPDSAYEAWTVSGPRGMMVVCMPGGELAIWDAEPQIDG